MTSTYKIINSDNIEAMRKMESNSVHNCITDPPWGISFLSGSKGTTWDNFSPENIKKHRHNKNKAKEKETTKRYRSMMAGEYTNTCKADREYQRWTTEWATEAIRVQKEGGFLLALCGTRTYGRLCCGIQEAGYNIKDTITFLTAQGFPKSHKIITKMSEEDAETYKGWQTPGLKPAITFIIIAQKPKKLTYAKNMIKNQVGCYNIDACRIGIDK